MVVEQDAIRTKREQSVVERPVARSFIYAFVCSDYQNHFVIAGSLGQHLCFVTLNRQAVSSQFPEDFFGRFVIPKRSAGTIVEPCWIAWQPGFAEDDELRALLRGFAYVLDGPREACFKVHEDRRGLNNRNFHHLILSLLIRLINVLNDLSFLPALRPGYPIAGHLAAPLRVP